MERRFFYVAGLTLVFSSLALGQTVRFVDADALPGGDGLSWATAYRDLQDALAVAQAGDQVWVAEGTYKPDRGAGYSAGDRRASFMLRAGIALYGGFTGTESARWERNPEQHETILSGDIGIVNSASDNCFHVVAIPGDVYGQTVSGFTITGGNANDDSGNIVGLVGAGILIGNPGPIHRYRASANINRCRIVGNTAAHGAGLFAHVSQVNTVSCAFIDNSASGTSGAIDAFGNTSEDNLSITNCVFSGNSGRSGALRIAWELSATVTNCTFSNNTATHAGGAIQLDLNDGSVQIANSILWGDTPDEIADVSRLGVRRVDYCDIAGGWSGVGSNNISADPLFCDPSSGLYRLQDGSPCIDAGMDSRVTYDPTDINDNGDVGETLPWDIVKFARQFGAIRGRQPLDMGAFENPHTQDCIHDLSGNGSVGIEDLTALLSCYGGPAEGACSPSDWDCDGIVGISDVTAILSAFGSCGP